MSTQNWLSSARTWVDLEASSLERAMRAAVPFASGRLVDVGCGDRPYETLFRTVVSDYVGVEYHETYRGSANDHDSVGPRGARPDVYYDGERLPFDDATFDTVLSNQVAEHVPYPRPFFAEMARVLRPGGCLIVTVPFSYREHAAPRDFHRFTQYALARYAEDLGLRVELLQARGGMWRAIGQKVTSHLALDVTRITRDLQSVGALSYEPPSPVIPRYWLLPLTGPMIVAVALGARALDRLDPVPSDTLGYVLVARKATRSDPENAGLAPG